MASNKLKLRKLNDFMLTPNGSAVTLGIITIFTALVFVFVYFNSVPEIKVDAALPKKMPEPKKIAEKTMTEEEKAQMEKFQVFHGKDPFTPLVDLSSSTDGGTGTASEGATPEDFAGEGSTGGTDGEETQTIALLDIFYEGEVLTAQVQVNGTEYKVKEGDSFASSYKVVTISPSAVTLLYGDDSIVLNLGEKITK